MSRTHISYSDAERRQVSVKGAVDVTTPVAGYYRYRLHSGAVRGGVRLWHGPPHDPVTGEEMDRSWRWQAEMDGEPIDFNRVWPACAKEPITEEEYKRYVARAAWARNHAPDSAYAERGRRHDPLSTKSPLPF